MDRQGESVPDRTRHPPKLRCLSKTSVDRSNMPVLVPVPYRTHYYAALRVAHPCRRGDIIGATLGMLL
jgi:hypothetical protein